MLAFVFALGALAAAPLAVPFDSPVEALDVGALVDAPDGFDPDDGTVFAAARKRAPARRTPARGKPKPRPQPRAAERNPALIGLAGAGGAAIGAAVGLTGVAIAGVFATGVAGEQPAEVVIATAAIAIAIAIATPVMAGIGGGAGVLLADDRARPEEWQGLLGCATTGCCTGIGSAFSSVLGGGIGSGLGGCGSIPGPERPAEWTAIAAVGGLVGGGLLGVVFGYIASDKSAVVVPMGIGGMSGALIGSSIAAGLAGGVASAIRP